MTGISRPLDSGRTDSLGRTVRVAGNPADTRANAPAPAGVALWEPYRAADGCELHQPAAGRAQPIGQGSWLLAAPTDQYTGPDGAGYTRVPTHRTPTVSQTRLGVAAAILRVDYDPTASTIGPGTECTVLLNGAAGVELVQGTLQHGRDGEPVVWPYDQRRAPINYAEHHDALTILPRSREAGYAQALDVWEWALSSTPELEPSSFDHLPVYDLDDDPDGDGQPRKIVAAYVGDGPDLGQGGDRRGGVFFATDISPEGDIVNGYHWFPERSGLVSEHGSMYTDDLSRRYAMVRGSWGDSDLTFGELVDDDHGITDLVTMMPQLRTWTRQP